MQRGELRLPAQSPFWSCTLRRSVLLRETGLSLLLCPCAAKHTAKERGNRAMFEKEQHRKGCEECGLNPLKTLAAKCQPSNMQAQLDNVKGDG